MSIASDFRTKMDVALNSATNTQGLQPDARRTVLQQDLDAAELVLMPKEMLAAYTTTIEALQAQVAARDAALARAEKWLRACSDWLLETDLDMKCPDTMDEDPLDIADDIAALGQGEG